jgi:cysteine desulfurase
MAKALELALNEQLEHQNYITNLKSIFKSKLSEGIPDLGFNGLSGELNESLYTVLNVSFPAKAANDMLLFNLDIEGISCSGGSACSSGTDVGSHVLAALNAAPDRANVRFSFSRFNTEAEVVQAAETVIKLVV